MRVIEIPHQRYVGARIGIHNPKGEKVGKVGRLRNVEYLFVATERPAGPARAASRVMAGGPSLARKLAGFGLLGLGVLGLVLPILQGILFLALGLFILRDQYDWAREGMAKLRARLAPPGGRGGGDGGAAGRLVPPPGRTRQAPAAIRRSRTARHPTARIRPIAPGCAVVAGETRNRP